MSVRIEADILIPGKGDPVAAGTVVLEEGTIAFAGARAGAPGGADDVVEVPALMPGMWDCHAHFVGLLVPDLEVEVKEHIALRAARATADVRRTLLAGFTSVREVGGLGIFLAGAVDEGTLPGPSIHPAGAILSTTGGHGDVHGLPLDWVTASAESGGALGELCDGVPQCLQAVRKQLRRGAKVIKICASGGVMSEIDHPIHQQFSDEELRAIVDEAARAERVVAAHCHGKPGIMAALRAGVKTIEHGTYLDEEAAEMMKERDAILVPTRFIISDLLGMEAVVPAYAYRKIAALAEQHEIAMKTAVAAGVTIAAGTDIFLSGDQYGKNSRELQHLMDAGLQPLGAIEAATANGPLTLGPQAPLSGQLREGYDADVIAFDTNPLDDPLVWGDPDRVTHVWKAGKLVKEPD